jgi:hypothetical protein
MRRNRRQQSRPALGRDFRALAGLPEPSNKLGINLSPMRTSAYYEDPAYANIYAQKNPGLV